MKSGRPNPPLALAIPALAYLMFEAWVCYSDPGMPKAVRFACTALLIVGVLRENTVAIPLWMLYSALGGLIFCIWSFRAVRESPTEALLYAVFAAMALANAGYVLFAHPRRHSKTSGSS